MFGRTAASRLARRYRREGDAYLVEVHLRKLRVLFNISRLPVELRVSHPLPS